MSESKIELINHQKIKHIKIFANRIENVSNHVHSDIEILVVLDGSGHIKLSNEDHKLKVGDIFLINSFDVHSISSVLQENKKKGGFLAIYYQISTHFLQNYYPSLTNTWFKSCNILEMLDDDKRVKIYDLLVDIARNYFLTTEFYQLDIVSDLAKVFSMILKDIPHNIISTKETEKIIKNRRRAERIMAFIDNNYNQNIRLEDLAVQENLSITYISHLCTEVFGMSFQKLVNMKRLDESITLMSNPKKTLVDIAYESGFSDLKYMNKMYNELFGCTSKQYRKVYALVNDSQKLNREAEHIYDDIDALEAINKYTKKKKEE